MAYERLHWVESETPLSADNMNNIEDGIEELQAQKVDKVSGKALSDQNYTAAEKTKLEGIAAGAEVNVQSDWNQSDSSADDFIKNKPGNASTSTAGLMSATDKSKLDGIAAGAQVNSITGVKGGAENSYRTGNVNITPANIGSYAKAESLTLGTVVSKSFTTTDQTYTLTSDAYVYFGGTSTSRVEVLQVNCLINGTVVACQSVYLDSLGTDAPVYSSILLKKGTQIKYKKIQLVDFTGATDSVSLKICPIS